MTGVRADGRWALAVGIALTCYAWYAKLAWRQVNISAFAGPVCLLGGAALILAGGRLTRPAAAGEEWYASANRPGWAWTPAGCLVILAVAAAGAAHMAVLLSI